MGKTIRIYEDEQDDRDYDAIKFSRRHKKLAYDEKHANIVSTKLVNYDVRTDD